MLGHILGPYLTGCTTAQKPTALLRVERITRAEVPQHRVILLFPPPMKTQTFGSSH